jgi:hypothetical protein
MNEIVAEDAPTGKDEDDNDDKHAADNWGAKENGEKKIISWNNIVR